jgi:low affinity Fe/Cu permease
MYRSSPFSRFSKWVAHATGHPVAFGLAALIVVGWLASGLVYGFSDTWQLAINTGTTIVAFLMVFLIQNTQNRDSHAMQIKLDELIRSIEGAHNALLDLEELNEQEHYCAPAESNRAEPSRNKQSEPRPAIRPMPRLRKSDWDWIAPNWSPGTIRIQGESG